MLKRKEILFNGDKYYLIGTLENYGNYCHDIELYEDCKYGDMSYCIIVNATTKKVLGYTYNGFDELYDNEYTPLDNSDYQVL